MNDSQILGGEDLLASRRSTCSIDEAAAVLGIGRSTAYAAARDGSLPTLRVSHRLLVPTAKLMAMLGVEPDS
jgi:excisionase family DNA binding protein